MKKVITAAFAFMLVLLSAAFVANCSYSSNTPTAHNNNTSIPQKPKVAPLKEKHLLAKKIEKKTTKSL